MYSAEPEPVRDKEYEMPTRFHADEKAGATEQCPCLMQGI